MTSYGILTTLPPSVYHPLNVCADIDPNLYSMLHFLAEWHITHYGRFAAILQFVAAELLGDVAQFAQHAEEAVYIKVLETDMKLWGTTSPSLDKMLESKAISALLAKPEERNPMYYCLCELVFEPGPDIC
jgi:hypothetical protein